MDGRRVLVVGAGRSGAAAARALLRHGATVTVVDPSTSKPVALAAAGLEEAGATVVVGRDSGSAVSGFDVIVPSPGVAQHHPLLTAAELAGVHVWSEPELAWRLSAQRTRMVAVTGTNGKTTTTELIAACLGAPTAGNIGVPLVDVLDSPEPPPLVVAELSSFQLRFCHTLRPSVAVLLNVAPDHLDWHGTERDYRAAKARIWRRQRETDTAIVAVDDPGAMRTRLEHPPPGATLGFTLGAPAPGQVGVADGQVVANLEGEAVGLVAVEALGVSGPHNLSNVCAAAGAALAAGAPVAGLAAPLSAYRAGRHRLDVVATVGGVTYVDDSKATNPHAAAAALSSFAPGTVVWIAGGLGKGVDFSALQPLVNRHVRTALTIGTNGPDIAEVARRAGVDVVDAGTLDVAVRAAASIAGPGDTVLLAPACASMDQFTDYAARGNAFRAAVSQLTTSPPAQGATCGR